MDQFIQKILACANIEENHDLIDSFPIISVAYQNRKARILLFRFSNHGIPNYAVIGLMKDDFVFEKDSFLEWLKNINELISFKPNKEKLELLEKFKRSNYSRSMLFTQEGFDLLNGKQYFTVGGLISRTALVSCHVCEDKSIIFYNELNANTYNQFLEGDLFREYEDYEQNYFLNYSEYHTMSYCNVLEYVEYNRTRLLKKVQIEDTKQIDLHYLMQILDSYLANGLFQGYSRS